MSKGSGRSAFLGAGVSLAAITSVLLTAAPASAHYVYEGGWTYRTQYDCTANRVETSHGKYNEGFSRSEVAAWEENWLGFQCTFPSSRPAGYIRTRIEFYKWNSSKKVWQLCWKNKGWWKNTRNAQQIDVGVRYKNGGRGLCGAGWYGTTAHGHQYNGGWHGGAMFSGSHWLPVS
ncbi:hypothetical protein [Streptomyces justiciae]|uniref:hypothetical protein n=1 Tax=Streptomyces justiciae TaxID=2780140 RepID=UPI002119B51E|nr:hypothetical protein [Streptomyces justiciae]MCW8384640.1 hypothetical protein [Streptomyces justiciae]